MKKIITVCILMMIAVLAFAHAPSEITINFDAKTGMVTVNVAHPLASSKVSDPVKHFIKEITVSVNGKTIIVETITFQQSENGETSSFLLKVKPGDKVSVKAVCNIIGAKTAEITIRQPEI